MPGQPKTLYTEAEYLEFEEQAAYKHDYYRGEIFSMAGGSLTRGELIAEAIAQLRPHSKGRGCRVYSSDVRVRIPATTHYCYPDISIACSEPKLLEGRKDTLLNPTVIIEVLSPSTEAYDRGLKFASYRSSESLQHYVMISSERVAVEVYSRQPNGIWALVAEQADGRVEIPGLGLALSVTDLYSGLDLGLSS